MAPWDLATIENRAVKSTMESLRTQNRLNRLRLPQHATDESDIHDLCLHHSSLMRRRNPHKDVEPDPHFMKLSSLNDGPTRGAIPERRTNKGHDSRGKLFYHAREVSKLAATIAPKEEKKIDAVDKAFARASMKAAFGLGFGGGRKKPSRASLRASGSTATLPALANPAEEANRTKDGWQSSSSRAPRQSLPSVGTSGQSMSRWYSEPEFDSQRLMDVMQQDKASVASWATGLGGDMQEDDGTLHQLAARRETAATEQEQEDYAQRLLASAFTTQPSQVRHSVQETEASKAWRCSQKPRPSQISKRMRLITRLQDELASSCEQNVVD